MVPGRSRARLLPVTDVCVMRERTRLSDLCVCVARDRGVASEGAASVLAPRRCRRAVVRRYE